jgi:PhnB protein
MTKINPYLNFPGNAEEAFNFYKSIFGGNFSSLVRMKDMPMPAGTVDKKDESKIMHVALPIGNDLLLASDALESHGRKLTKGNNAYVMVSPDSKAEADRIFKALSAGGTVEMAMANQPWGDYYGSLKDKFGVMWMVDFAYPKTAK